ncbi:hypothetical protein QQP08_024984 [Theobroma cacao]|nr:hypothetical protein QQP08_024984 [Theobroma cacao]
MNLWAERVSGAPKFYRAGPLGHAFLSQGEVSDYFTACLVLYPLPAEFEITEILKSAAGLHMLRVW